MTGSTPRYAPDFRVTVGGEPLPAAMRASITNVTLQNGLEGADRVELTLHDPALRWLDHPLLAVDRPLTLSLGYAPDPLERVFVGRIVGLSPSFPGGGAPTLNVVAQDERHRLQQGTKARWFAIPGGSSGNYPIPDIGVAAMVSAEDGLIPIFDPIGAAISVIVAGAQMVVGAGDPQEAQRVIRRQSGSSDHDFLRTIARENGWELVIEHGGPQGGHTLRFLSLLDHLEPSLAYRYGGSLLEFAPRLTTVGDILAVRATVWQPALKMEFAIEVAWDWDRQSLALRITPGYGAATSSGGSSGPALTLVDEPITVASAPRVILGRLLPRLNGRLTGTGSVIGEPRLRAGVVLRIEGVGERFGGLYRVTSATHTLGAGGYRTSFEVRKEVWFGSIPNHAQGSIPVRLNDQPLMLEGR